jgi:adenylate cyclase
VTPADADTETATAARRIRFAQALKRANQQPGVLRAIRATRELLPGDSRFGDELSTAGDRPSDVLARHLLELKGSGESVSRETGLAAIQVWQALSEKLGRGAGTVSVTILFTDLVGFSSWVLEVGDELALDLLRAVASVVEPTIDRHRGRLVKRLGDGHMAVFPSAQNGVDAALTIQDRLVDVEVDGHRPSLRQGLHRGTPRKLGGDYLGADVNIAARVGDAAGPGEVLVSDAVLAGLDRAGLDIKRRRRFQAKGAPRELEVYRVRRAR